METTKSHAPPVGAGRGTSRRPDCAPSSPLWLGVLCGMLPYLCGGADHRRPFNRATGDAPSICYGAWWRWRGFLSAPPFTPWLCPCPTRPPFPSSKAIRETDSWKSSPGCPWAPILDTSSGQMKQIIVDQVESMERPLAHLLPEMTANVLGPVCILIYLFVLDWRMALLSLVSIPVGMAFMMAVMASYGKQYEGSVKTTQAMNSAIVEYIGGIEVIKAFNQGKQSYARFSDSVKGQRLLLLPLDEELPDAHLPGPCHLSHHHDHHSAGGLAPLRRTGVCPSETFITTIVLSLGIAGPAAGRHGLCGQSGQGRHHRGLGGRHSERRRSRITGTRRCSFGAGTFSSRHVSFGYHADKEVLHDVSLTIPAGSMTAFVGPSGSGKSTIAKLIAGFWDVTARHHHPGRAGSESRSRLPSSTTRWPLSPRTTTSLTRACGRTSAWAAPAPPTQRWRRWPKPPGATASSAAWNMAMTPWWAAAAPISPAASGSASPSPGPC